MRDDWVRHPICEVEDEMTFYLRRVIEDILGNRFLNAVTIVTFALSVFLVSASGLFFINAQDQFDRWKKGIRIMVYLVPGTTDDQCQETKERLMAVSGVRQIRFVSKQQALELLKGKMVRQRSLLENLRENPLPDAFEVSLAMETYAPERVEFLSRRIESLASVSEVEYGRQWIERFGSFFNLFKLAGYSMGAMFFMATMFITANTIRLMLYARREEIQIMRLVGATDSFIRNPFFLEGMIYGLFGSVIGLGLLYGAVLALGSQFEQSLAAEVMTIRFFPPKICAAIIGWSMMTGLLGCFFSLRQFLKK